MINEEYFFEKKEEPRYNTIKEYVKDHKPQYKNMPHITIKNPRLFFTYVKIKTYQEFDIAMMLKESNHQVICANPNSYRVPTDFERRTNRLLLANLEKGFYQSLDTQLTNYENIKFIRDEQGWKILDFSKALRKWGVPSENLENLYNWFEKHKPKRPSKLK